jgi:bifunctional NMN adenylyltransferase/nudix hydrolase
MNTKINIDKENIEIGVIIGRFQTNTLHEGHLNLISHVLSNHKKTIILLGVSRIQNTKKNPLDFASRKAMIQKLYPSVVILPIMDQRSNEKWSQDVDNAISLPFGEKKAIIYGSRDSFIPFYSGKNHVIELESSQDHNATNIRAEVAKEVLDSSEFRAGVIYSTFNQRPVTYPTVDVVVHDGKGNILLAKKPHEQYWRFVGGFVDRTDKSYEEAAYRELSEETGGNLNVTNARYIASIKVEDWRYKKEESGIMTTLFLMDKLWGSAKASDDIAEVSWIPIHELSNENGIRTKIMEEHRALMRIFIDKVYNGLIPAGERLKEVEGVTYISEQK